MIARSPSASLIGTSGHVIGNSVTANNSGSMSFSANQQVLNIFNVMIGAEIDGLGLSVSSAGASVTCKMLLFATNPDTGRPTDLLVQSDPIDCSTTGNKIVTIPTTTIEAGKLYWLGAWSSGTFTARATNSDAQRSAARDPFSPASRRHAVVRTETYGGTASTWVYSGAQHDPFKQTNDLFCLVRIA